jgi:hypothetical protein
VQGAFQALFRSIRDDGPLDPARLRYLALKRGTGIRQSPDLGEIERQLDRNLDLSHEISCSR